VILLVRHGETSANARGLLLGRANPSLSGVGREQAYGVAELLRRELGGEQQPLAVLSSPLRRARETAECIADVFELDVEDEPAMMEMDYGEWDERPLAEIPREVWVGWRDDVDFAPPGGESLRSVQTRVSACMGRVADRGGDGVVVVVSHVSPIKAAVLWALGVDDRPELSWRLRLDLASVTRIGPGPLGSVLMGFNQRPHSA
jgi:probable phosphoglycerate mutase